MTRLNAYVHTTISPHHHQHICIYEFINNSSPQDIYAITNTFTIQLTYMCSPITTQSTNIYAFTSINLFYIHQASLGEFSSQVKVHKVFSNQFRAIGKQIKPLKTFMFMPKVDSKQKRVKGTRNTKHKNWAEATCLASDLLAMAGETCPLLPHCSPWRVALLAVAGKHGSLWPRCSPRGQAYSPWRVLTVGCHEKLNLHPKIPILNPSIPKLISRIYPNIFRH